MGVGRLFPSFLRKEDFKGRERKKSFFRFFSFLLLADGLRRGSLFSCSLRRVSPSSFLLPERTRRRKGGDLLPPHGLPLFSVEGCQSSVKRRRRRKGARTSRPHQHHPVVAPGVVAVVMLISPVLPPPPPPPPPSAHDFPHHPGCLLLRPQSATDAVLMPMMPFRVILLFLLLLLLDSG